MHKKAHPLILLLLAIIFIITTFFKLSSGKLVIMYVLILPYLINDKESVKEYFQKILYIVSAVFMLVVLKIIYAHDSRIVILQYALRLFFLFSVSMLSFLAVDFDKVFVFLMSAKKMKVKWGYPLLLAMNSLHLLKREQERVSFNAKLRNLKWHQRYLVFFPILVFAIRHAERGAMALVTRGLNEEKFFYHVSIPTKRDRVILISYFLLALILILFN